MAAVAFPLLVLTLFARLVSSRLLLDTPSHGVEAIIDSLDEAPIADSYVVLFKPDAGSATEATRLLQQQLSGKRVAAAAASNSSAGDSSFAFVSSLNAYPGSSSTSSDDDATTKTAAASVVDDSSSSSSRGVQGVVVKTSAGIAAKIKQSQLVAAVFPDRVVKAQGDTCVEARFLSSGHLAAATSSSLKWPRCLDGTTRPVWVAKRCGSDFTQLEYTAMYAVDRISSKIKIVSGEQCVLLADPNRAAWQRQRFGSCGRAPLYAPTLPTRICAATNAGLQSCIHSPKSAASLTTLTASLTMSAPVRCGAGSAIRFTFTGVTCGPNKDLVQWILATSASGCVLRASSNPKRQKWTQEVFGSCGVPPGNATASASSTLCPPDPESPSPVSPSPVVNPDVSPSPSPVPEDPQDPIPNPPEPTPENPSDPAIPDPSSLLLLPRSPLLSGEEPPSGLTLIGGVTAAGVVNGAGLPLDSQVTVGVIDSGVDGTHPDIYTVGGKSWVLKDAVDDAANEADALTDGFGHGTHVAGIVGAKNNGAGVVGVSPGIPVYSLRVLDSNGRGTLSSVLSAVNWVITEGLAKGIKVLNLSLAAYVDPNSPGYAETHQAVCSVFQQASDAGILVTVAAGNYGASMHGYLPASCPTVVAVTAVNAEGTGPASYTNFLPATVADELKSHVIAAPGTNIRSTVSYARDSSGYRTLSGTSMAAPHVAGVAANCIMSKACPAGATGQQILSTIQSNSQQRLSFGRYGFAGDATSTIDGKYLGFFLWSGF